MLKKFKAQKTDRCSWYQESCPACFVDRETVGRIPATGILGERVIYSQEPILQCACGHVFQNFTEPFQLELFKVTDKQVKINA